NIFNNGARNFNAATFSGSNLLVSNNLYGATSYGVYLQSGNNDALISNYIYANGSNGLRIATNVTVSTGSLGYDASGNNKPNGSSEVSPDPVTTPGVILQGVSINPN